MFLGVRPCPHVWVVGERRQRRRLCNQYRCLLFFYWKNYSTWLFLWSSVLVFNRSADLMISQNPHARHDRWWSRRRPSALRYRNCGAKNLFFSVSEIFGFRKLWGKQNAREWGAQSPSSCQKAHFPILGKVWSPGESCPVYPEFGIRSVIPIFALTRIPVKRVIVKGFLHGNSG